MKYCSACGATLSVRIPPGDNRERYVCDACAAVHYQNPRIVAGCVLAWEHRVLLCRRAIEPRYGYWTVPAGFMENGETTAEAAAREAREEACAEAADLVLYGLYNLRHIDQVYVLFRGRLQGGAARAGDESLEVDLFDRDEIPWSELAFPVVRETLERYFEERADASFRVHYGDIVRGPDGRVRIHRR
ncbi:MAG: NUDIX hydrolase [Candidatus Competibacterales bacterium]|nr:NUDIX hydrolase [Candidatus Competibacterales bacterium]